MPPSDSTTLVVARFLKSNHYSESYATFIREAGLPETAGDVSEGDLTLDALLEEKKTFDLNVKFEKLGVKEEASGWTEPAPMLPHPITDLPSNSNILSVTVAEGRNPGASLQPLLLASTADRRLNAIQAATCTLKSSLHDLHDAPILSCALLNEEILLSTSMSGQIIASDLEGSVRDKRRDHAKYVVKIAVLTQDEGEVIATAGWDAKINIYRTSSSTPFRFGDPISTISLQSKPEAMLLLRHPDNSKPILLVTRTDSNFFHYYTTETEPRLLGKQNLAPHSNAWVAFTPSSVALCPTDPSVIAVGTSSVPHMKLLIVNLLIPPYEAPPALAPVRLRTSLLDDGPASGTQASRARAELAVADREEAAIRVHCTTMAPQTAYSTPAVAWRPDGSGVWVNGDDGAIRGVEAATGKVVATLEGHEAGSKVRCLWAGEVRGSSGMEEWLVSGGFDQKLIVWKAKSGQT